MTTFFWNDAPNNRLDITRLERGFDVSIAWAAALFLFLSALFHFIVSTVGRKTYESEIAAGQNRFRWVEYSVSSTLMIIAICLVFGIGDIAGLLGIAGANIAMILFGWIMEVVNKPGRKVWWTPFWFGCIVGIVPCPAAMMVRFVDDRIRSRVAGMRLAISLGASSFAVWLIGPVVRQAGFSALLWVMCACGLLTLAVVSQLPRSPASA